MKSLIKVLVVFWISQSVCCDIFSQIITIRSNSLNSSHELIEAFLKVIQNCDIKEIQNQVSLRSSGKIDLDLSQCDDEEAKQKLFYTYDYVSSFFENCIDPQYIQVVEKLHSAVLKMIDLLCTTNKYQLQIISIFEMMNDKMSYDENILQVASCIFSEQEMTRMSKNVSQVVDFTAMLIEGNDNECGVVDRIGKCIQKTMKSRKNYHKVIGSTIKIMLELFDCEINESTELSQETTAEPLRLNDFMSLKEKIIDATKECDLKEYQNKIEFSVSKSVLSSTGYMTNDKIMQLSNSSCDVHANEMFFLFIIYKIEEDLKNCIDTKYVEYVDKIMKSVKRAIYMNCEIIDQQVNLFSDYKNNDENTLCVKEKEFPLYGCVFSSEDIREIVADSSKLSNFTMNLLGGGDKECGIIDGIGKCIIDSLDSCTPASNLLKYEFNLVMKSMECKINYFHNTSSTTEQWTKSRINQSPITIRNNMIKEFTFMNFNEAFGFMTRVALYASEIKYYPTLTNEDNKVIIKLKSKDSDKEQQMAAFINKVSKSEQ